MRLPLITEIKIIRYNFRPVFHILSISPQNYLVKNVCRFYFYIIFKEANDKVNSLPLFNFSPIFLTISLIHSARSVVS